MTGDEVQRVQFEAYRLGYRDGFREAISSFPPPHGQPSAASSPPGTNEAGVSINPEWIPLYHRGNGNNADAPDPCGNVSHYLTEKVVRGHKASTEFLRKLTGVEPRPDEQPVCGSCSAPINPWSQSYLDYTPALIDADDPPSTLTPAAVSVPPLPPSPPLRRLDPVQQQADDVIRALATLEQDRIASSKPPDLPKTCLRCGMIVPDHTQTCLDAP